LGVQIALFGGQSKPANGLGGVFLDAQAICIENAEIILRGLVFLAMCLPEFQMN